MNRHHLGARRLAALSAVLFLAACSGGGGQDVESAAPSTTIRTTTTTSTTAPTASDAAAVVAALQKAGLPLQQVVVFTAEDDPNELLGRPNQYTSKASWVDARIADKDSLDPEPGVDYGGSVEAFDNTEDAKARFDYLEQVASAPPFGEYHWRSGTVVLRASFSLTPDQASEYERVVNEL